MFCTECGLENEDKHIFCTGCGSELRAGGAAPGPVDAAPGGAVPAGQFGVNALQRLVYQKRERATLSGTPGQGIKGKPLKWFAIAGASVLVLAAAVVLLFPRASLAVDALTVPEQVVSGDDFIVSVTVENTGRAAGARTLVLFIDGEEYLAKEVSVEARSQETVQFAIQGVLPAGVYQVSLEELAAEVRILKPAEFELSKFSLEPNPQRTGEAAKAAVEVSNLGEVEGSYTLSLTIDGEVEQTEEVTLAGGSSTTVSFSLLINEPGRYRVGINDLGEDFEVWQIERPNNGTVFVNNLKGGYGHLSMYNGNDQDALIVLASPANPQEALLSVYVRSKSRYTVTGIKNGTYLVFYAIGDDWESYSRRFTRNAYHEKFEKEASYTAVYPRYTIISIELNIAEGTARTDWIPEDKFPR